MTTVYHLTQHLLDATFSHFRACGRGRRECQVLWLSSWDQPEIITDVVHPEHKAHVGGFVLDDRWLSAFWLRLGRDNKGVRIQVHTHPRDAFHSLTDDQYPIIHTPGFLSLVIPDFGLGTACFEQAFLTEIQADGRWHNATIRERLLIK